MGICKYSWSPLLWKRISSSRLSVLAGWAGERSDARPAAETGRGGQGSSPSLARCPRSARFPDSHLQGQDAVVPHKRLAVTTSFKSLSGLPATIKGHVCNREEGGGGKHSWTGGGVSGSPSDRRGACVRARGTEGRHLQFTRCVSAWQDKADPSWWW